jgi:hypothetical protein
VTIDSAEKRQSSLFYGSLLRLLTDSQNADGGWGYHPSGESATEPTAWALCALRDFDQASSPLENSLRAKKWLLANQRDDGSWPQFASQNEGCWVTSLGAIALNEFADATNAVDRGLDWLANTWPRTPNFFQRLRQRFAKSSNITRQNNSLTGWPWTAKTSSWVEPTAYALILMNRVPRDRLSNSAIKRRAIAEAMLCDRICPGGGWNSGNPMVYGVAGEPLVGPTVWALLALQNSPERPEVRQSLDWLEKQSSQIRGSLSAAIAHMCLESYGRSGPSIETQLQANFEADRFLNNLCVVALAALALAPARKIFPPKSREAAPR